MHQSQPTVMNSKKGSLSSSAGLNKINPGCDGMIGEFVLIKEEDTSEYSIYCGESFNTPSDSLPVEPTENQTTITDGVRTVGEQYREEIFIKTEIKLENVDAEGDCRKMSDEESDPLHFVKDEGIKDEVYLEETETVQSKF